MPVAPADAYRHPVAGIAIVTTDRPGQMAFFHRLPRQNGALAYQTTLPTGNNDGIELTTCRRVKDV